MIAVMTVASCTGIDIGHTPTLSESSSPEAPAQPNGVPRTLELAARDHQKYLVQAPDPSTHTLEVRLVAKPLAKLSLWFLTPNGRRLDVVRSTVSDEGCLAKTDRVVCLDEFPILEAQLGGSWAVHVRNASNRSTTAEIVLTFTRV
jgi:hypothetical protein